MIKEYIFTRTLTGILVVVVIGQHIVATFQYPDDEDRSLLGFAGQYHLSDSDTSVNARVISLSIVSL